MNFKLLELRSYMIDENIGVYEMLQEIPYEDEFEQHNDFFGKTKLQCKKMIDKLIQYAYGLNNSEDNPQCETYVLFADGKPVCIGGLMIKLTDFWRKHRGHIWYKTRPTERKKGYCTKFTELICKRAKQLGMKEIISQCDVNNYGSNKVLINNGFVKYVNPLCPDWDDTNFYKKKL